MVDDKDQNRVEEDEDIVEEYGLEGWETGYPEWERTERDRGFLTESDRKFLAGKKELEGQQKRNARYRVRQRTIAGLQDVAFVDRHLIKYSQDRMQIANDSEIRRSSLRRGALAMVYSLFLFDDEVNDALGAFEEAIGTMLRNNHPYDEAPNAVLTDRSVHVDLEVDDELIDLFDLQTKVQFGNATLTEMVLFLSENGRDDLAEELDETVEDIMTRTEVFDEQPDEEYNPEEYDRDEF